MFTEIQNKDNSITSIVTQQYAVGTYIIINNNPTLQGSSPKKERDYHIYLRRKVLKNKDLIINGTILDYNGKLPLNDFVKCENNIN